MSKRRIRRRLKKNVKVTLVFILLILVIFIVKPFSKTKEKIIKPSYEYQNKIINNTDKELDDGVKKLLIDFYNVYFRSMKELKVYDSDKFFTDDSEDKKLYKTAVEVLIESRKKQLTDLKLKDVKYDLTITKINTKDNTIDIELTEDSYLDFNFLNFTSKVYNVLNTFKIVKNENEYKIKSIYKEQGFFVMIQNLIDEDYNYDEELQRIKTSYLTTFDSKLEEQKILNQEYLENKDKEFKKCDHEYDREKAVKYALKYVNKRDESKISYDVYGGNCQNYASWALNNGGIPMDYTGTSQWKHYSGSINERNVAGGRSTSWTGVSQFYVYAKNNKGFGLCGEVNVNPYYAQKGDIIQVGYSNKYRHTALVMDTYSKDDNVIDVILTSNTGDLEYYPLSAYVYPEKRLIKILGWNN